MLVQIIKSEKDSYWYAECIGEIFEVVEDDSIEVYVLQEDIENAYDIGNRHISKEDCKVINPE